MLKLAPIPQSLPRSDLLAIPVAEDAEPNQHPQIRQLIAQAAALREFSGQKKQQLTMHHLLDGTVQRALFLGVGKPTELTAETLRVAAGRAVKSALEWKLEQLTLVMPWSENSPLEPAEMITALLEGACLANHVDDSYREASPWTALKGIVLWVPTEWVKPHRALATRTAMVCRAANKARQWVNIPPNDKAPPHLARLFAEAAQQAHIDVTVMNETQLKRQKFNALLAVAAGSVHSPRLVEMVYKPANARKTIVLVGKGVTFDTGGINLKASQGLETMKCDMSGAAAVAATMTAMKALKPGMRVVGVTPLVENMPSGSATRPGDIVRSHSGKTVEIQNTDAEGRLILSDAMVYALKKYKPDIIIDIATLTGACVVALGEKIAGVFSHDNTLAEAIIAAGEAVHERCWRLPLPEDYKELLKSDLADISNMSTSRYGGAITAALFLSAFVDAARWAHIDIAGPAYSKKGSDYCGPGGTGFGVRLLCRLIEDMAIS